MLTQEHDKILSKEQYKTISKWFERAGLLFLGSLVVQNLLQGAPFDSQVVFAGVVASVVAYLAAFLLLTKS